MTLFVTGLSHKTAPVDVREKIAFNNEQLPMAVSALQACHGITESIILSTCNRTEVYCELDIESDNKPARWLQNYCSLEQDDIEPHLYRFQGEQAVQHILRVASGLDSLVLGETQILGQLKDAYRVAVDVDAVGKILNQLLQFSFSTAKLVRSETRLGSAPVSVAYAAVKLAKQIYGDLSSRSAILIGAGDTIALVANHLAEAPIGRLIIANRTLHAGQVIADRCRGEAIQLTELANRIKDVDVIISSTSSRLPIVTLDIIRLALQNRRVNPMFIVDLAVPRDVDPAVGELRDVYLYTIDNLENVIRSNLELRREAAAYGEEMVLLQAQGFMSRQESQSSDEAIATFRARGEHIRDEVLAKAAQRLARGDDPQAVLKSLAHTLTNKLLHHPTDGLRTTVGQDALKTAAKLLGLDDK